MTREETDFIGAMNMCDEISNEAYKKIMCHCEEKEPCEDAISRKAAVVQLHHNKTGDDDIDVIIEKDIATIQTLPPVIPKQKTGKWIYDENGMDWGLAAWICSECHVRNMNIPPNMKFGKNEIRKIANPLMFQGSKFCPNCGAKMENEK